MAEYIEREAAIQQMADNFRQASVDGCDNSFYHIAEETLADMPAADVVEVVRCKDCKHSELYFFADNGTTRIEQYKCVHHRMSVNVLEPDDFCSYGERRDTEC